MTACCLIITATKEVMFVGQRRTLRSKSWKEHMYYISLLETLLGQFCISQKTELRYWWWKATIEKHFYLVKDLP